MVLWGPQLLLHRLIALQAVAEWLGGLHSRPGYQGGIAFFWFRLSLELQAVTASHAPDGAASTEASKSSDAHDDDSAVTSDPVNELRSQSEQLAFGVTLLPSPDDEGSRSARALRLKDQLENLGVQRRKTLANLRNRRLRWSGESSYIRYRMKKDPAAFESPEAVALLKAKYRSAADKKRQAISALEQSVSDMKIEEARLRSRLAECRTGSGCAPGEPRAQGLPGPSAATGQSHGNHRLDRLTFKLYGGRKTDSDGNGSYHIGDGFRNRASFCSSDNLCASTASNVAKRSIGSHANKTGSDGEGDSVSAESERRERHSKRSWSHLLSARKAMAPADSGGVGSGPLLGLEERMELLRAQKRKTQNSLRCLRHQWSTEETYIKHRISAAKRQLAKRGGAPAFPSSETLESYRQTYRTRVVTRRQEMGVLEKLIHEMEIEEEQLRSRLLKCRSKAGEAPTEPSTEGHAGASTSTSQSQGLTVTGRSDIESGSAETESADLPEEASPVPGCSWWSIISPAELLGPTPKSAESSPPAEDRVKMLESELRLLRARRSNLISMRHNLRYKWKNEASYLHTKLLMLKYRRKAKNMATVGLSPELHQRLSQQYRERAPQHLARVEEMSRQIMALEEEAKEVAVQLLHARRLSDPAVETQTQASTVSSATEPAETSEVAGHHSPRDTIHARRDLVKSHSEPALEKPLDEAVASPFVAQIPSRSPTPVTTTEGASRESAALASTTHSMASGDLTTSSDWFTHAERTSESPSPLILHHQTAPLFAAGAPEAVVYGGPCTSGDSGGPPYSLSQIFEHAGAAHTTGYPRTESDIPEDVVEFVLSHSAPAVMASEDGAALFAESAPSFNQPWSSEYPPPRIVSPSEQAATSASLFQPTTSASDEGATLFAVPASSSAFSGPGWSSPQLQPSWYFPGALGHYAPVFGEPLPPEPRQPLLQSPARAPPADVIPPHAAQPSTAFVDVPSMFQQSQLRSPQLLSMRVRPSDSTSTTPPSLTSPSRRITASGDLHSSAILEDWPTNFTKRHRERDVCTVSPEVQPQDGTNTFSCTISVACLPPLCRFGQERVMSGDV